MTTPTAELLFGAEAGTPMSTDSSSIKPWANARTVLEQAPKVWLSTVRPGGAPHAMPVLVVWVDDAPHFTSRPGSRKSRNLDTNPKAVVTVASADHDLDVVVEGTVARVHGEGEQKAIAAAFLDKYDWAFTLRDGSSFDDSLPGSPEYAFYRLTPARAFGYGSDGLTATRWRFGS